MNTPQKRVLMVAYHFPPVAGSSGLQRTLRLVKHLPEFGWQPLVLTATPCAYEQTSDDQLTAIAPETVVRRAIALDAARHLSIRGSYPGFAARPDRWISWKFDGIRQGLQIIKEFRPQAIWSTYPIATAHVIGHALACRSQLPWIADFRDPMAQEGYPAEPKTWKAFKNIEENAIAKARFCLFTAPGAAAEYCRRYPDAVSRIGVVENGYDEDAFLSAEQAIADQGGRKMLDERGPTLLHSGIVYPDERNPSALFAAFGQAIASGALVRPLRLRFRAPVHNDMLHRMAQQHGVSSRVDILPPVPYEEALAEMLRADGLLVLQAANCNEQIPAKLYEYLRARRPIVALTDPSGDTGRLVASAGIEAIARLDDIDAITRRLVEFSAESSSGFIAHTTIVDACSRRMRARQVATYLDQLS